MVIGLLFAVCSFLSTFFPRLVPTVHCGVVVLFSRRFLRRQQIQLRQNNGLVDETKKKKKKKKKAAVSSILIELSQSVTLALHRAAAAAHFAKRLKTVPITTCTVDLLFRFFLLLLQDALTFSSPLFFAVSCAEMQKTDDAVVVAVGQQNVEQLSLQLKNKLTLTKQRQLSSCGSFLQAKKRKKD